MAAPTGRWPGRERPSPPPAPPWLVGGLPARGTAFLPVQVPQPVPVGPADTGSGAAVDASVAAHQSTTTATTGAASCGRGPTRWVQPLMPSTTGSEQCRQWLVESAGGLPPTVRSRDI